MLKINLFAIIIVTLGLIMTINTFGQTKNDKPKRSDVQIKPMYVANQEEYMAGGIADVRGGAKNNREETARKSTTSQKQNFVSKPNVIFMDYTDDSCFMCKSKSAGSDAYWWHGGAEFHLDGMKNAGIKAPNQPKQLCVCDLAEMLGVKGKQTKGVTEYGVTDKVKGKNLGDTVTLVHRRKRQN